MTGLDDHELLAEYARTGSEAAFAALVERYVNLVYSTALRFTGNPHHAQEITQAVFIILARKAGSLRGGTVLSGWLYQTARLTAANFVKGEIRRQRREQEAYMQSTLTETDAATWEHIAPLLDEAMGRLGETDRTAVVLRFFENKTAQEAAATLKLNEAAAHKRVTRALEKLRKFFTKRGVALSAGVIAGAVSSNSVQAAPMGLAKTISAVAIAKGAAAGGSTLTLVKGALKIMAWTKAKTAVAVAAAVVLSAGTATVIVAERGNSAQYTQEGWKLWQDRKFKEAAIMFNKAVKLDPKNIEAWNGLGWSTFNSGNSQDAEKDFQKVLSLNPAHGAALNGLGQIYLSQKRYDEAETIFLQANVPAAWFGLARIYLLQGKFGDAEKWAQKIVDSGQGDQTANDMLQAAKDKRLPDSLRATLEPR